MFTLVSHAHTAEPIKMACGTGQTPGTMYYVAVHMVATHVSYTTGRFMLSGEARCHYHTVATC